MDHARVLVRSVARAFYDTECIVVIDALVNHSALSLPDLALVLDIGKNVKPVQKLCGRLKEGGLVSVYTRDETREGALKPIKREYYYIDYRKAIDSVKYRIHMIDEQVKNEAKPSAEKKEYSCPQCKSQWTQMEVLDNIDPLGRGSGFLCRRCQHVLEFHHTDDEEPEEAAGPANFNKQFGQLLSILQKIDATTVPAVTGESAMAEATPVPRDERVNPIVKTEVVNQQLAQPSSVKGLQNQHEKIEISITTEEEGKAAAEAAEVERKARIAAQNQMPNWHKYSTVKPESTGISKGPEVGPAPVSQSNGEEKKVVETNGGDAAMDEYFRKLEEERRREQQQDEEDEEGEDEEDDEGDFEDVVLKSGPAEGDTPASKRVKIEEPHENGTASAPAVVAADTPTQNGEGDESDEDFEDAL